MNKQEKEILEKIERFEYLDSLGQHTLPVNKDVKDNWYEWLELKNNLPLLKAELKGRKDKTKEFKDAIEKIILNKNLTNEDKLVDIYKAFEQGEKKVIEREEHQKCLMCGKSLHREIMDCKIHIHLCTDCRKIKLNEISKEITRRKKNERRKI